MIALAIYNTVRLVWVPGHCGIEGNERVHLLAKQASSSCFIGPEPSVGISVSTIRSSIRSWAVPEQNRLWQALPKCRHAKLLLNKLDKSLARFALSLMKKDLRILSGLLSLLVMRISIDTCKLWVFVMKQFALSAKKKRKLQFTSSLGAVELLSLIHI